MCSDTDNEVCRFAEDDDEVEDLLIKSFPSNIESQCCHEFQTACLAEENKNTHGVREESYRFERGFSAWTQYAVSL